MHLDDVLERADLFQNELIIFSHFSTRYHAAEIRKLIEAKLPARLRDRVRIWL
jgi:ribonuclease Z